MLNLKSIRTTAYRVPLKVCLIADSSKCDMESSQTLIRLVNTKVASLDFFSLSVASEISSRKTAIVKSLNC